MSVAELKDQIAGLSAKERLELALFLAELDETHEAAFQTEVDKRMKAMDAGKHITEEEFLRRHTELRSQGR